jgi:Ca2+-binding RTX toxin-like protein
MGFFKRQNSELERELRAQRPTPSDELVETLAASVRPRPRVAPRRRLALAGSATAAMLVTVAAIGGIGYAADAGSQVAHTLKRALAPVGITIEAKPTAASDEYGGTGGADNINGTARNDTINTGAGADRINAGAGNDRINSGSGNDRINPGPGRDRVNAGTGNDYIYSRDGQRDVVNAGPGRDTCVADRIDVLISCEIVRRA